MPVAARSTLAGHRQADAPAQLKLRVKEEFAVGTLVKKFKNEVHREASNHNI
jgi:hypothetical protein